MFFKFISNFQNQELSYDNDLLISIMIDFENYLKS